MRRCSASCRSNPARTKVAGADLPGLRGILNWHCVDALTAQLPEAASAETTPAPPVRKPPPPPPPELSQIVETTPEATPSAPPQKSPVQRLKELKEAYEAGLISEEAMERKRDEILAAM